MAIEEMIFLNMTFDRQDLNEVLVQLKESQHFYPQPASKIVNNVKGVHALREDNIYTKLIDEVIQVASDLHLDLHADKPCQDTFDYQAEMTKVEEIAAEITKIKDIQNQLLTEKEENEVTFKMLTQLNLREVDLDQLLSSQYIHARFGRFRRQSLDKIKYYEGRPFLFDKLGEDQHYVWCCYIVTSNLQLEVDNIFQALGFEEVKIPSFVHGTLSEAKKELADEIDAMKKYIDVMDQKRNDLKARYESHLLQTYATALFLQQIEAYKVFVIDYQKKCGIYGFIPRRSLESFQDHLKDISSIDYQELPVDILEHQQVISPTVMDNSAWVKPFEVVSKVKQSDKIDTTIAFAVLYYAVFAIFLGDLGIGAILTLFGIWMRKSKMGSLLLALGIATFIGGLVYGDVFYTVDLYPSLTFPLETIFKVIDGFVLLGVGTFTINVFKTMYLEHSTVERVFSMKGISGLIIVYTVLVYLGSVYEAHINWPIMPVILVVLSCFVLIVAKAIMKRQGKK